MSVEKLNCIIVENIFRLSLGQAGVPCGFDAVLTIPDKIQKLFENCNGKDQKSASQKRKAEM